MPRGPKGEKRPGNTIQAAIQVARIATGEEEEEIPNQEKRSSGKTGGRRRAKALTPEQRSDIGRRGATSRWSPDKEKNT